MKTQGVQTNNSRIDSKIVITKLDLKENVYLCLMSDLLIKYYFGSYLTM